MADGGGPQRPSDAGVSRDARTDSGCGGCCRAPDEPPDGESEGPLIQVAHKGRRLELCLLPEGLSVRVGQAVVVEVERGIDLGRVARMGGGSLSSQSGRTVHPVLRLASPEEIEQERSLRERDAEVLRVFKERVAHYGLPMRCIDAEQQLDGNRIHFYFASEGRVDFRELVRDLARLFRTRIELHQISPRESARRQGGLGPCGRTLCCTSFLQEIEISRVREARLLAPAQTTQRMTGVCGRLLCCLAYTQNGEAAIGSLEA